MRNGGYRIKQGPRVKIKVVYLLDYSFTPFRLPENGTIFNPLIGILLLLTVKKLKTI